MNLLRDRWRRSALLQFWQGLDTADRATALIGIVLAFAAAVAIQAIVRAYRVDVDSTRFTAPPFDMQVAETAR